MSAIFNTPGPSEVVLNAEVELRKRNGRYSLSLHVLQPYATEEAAPMVEELRKFLEDSVKKLNGK
jgi:hypothetical protein